MSNGLIAWVVAIALGFAVVVMGLRRDLGDVTRAWLPRFGKAPESATATSGSFAGGSWGSQLSHRQRKLAICLYLLLSAGYAALVILSSENRPLHAISVAIWAVGAVVIWKRAPSGRSPKA